MPQRGTADRVQPQTTTGATRIRRRLPIHTQQRARHALPSSVAAAQEAARLGADAEADETRPASLTTDGSCGPGTLVGQDGEVQALLLGLGIGLAAGVSPGPLLVLVITATLRGGLVHGAAVATAPLLSDVIVVGVTLVALGQIPGQLLTALGAIGAVAVIAVGAQTIGQARGASLTLPAGTAGARLPSTVRHGVLVNLLSPHPWISWATVLGPLTLAQWRDSPAAGVLFVVGFYLALVGSKVGVAALVAGGRRHLTESGYRVAVVTAGVALVALGLLMIAEFGSRLMP